MITLIKKLFSYKIIRFLFWGSISTVVYLVFYFLFIYLGVHYILANVISSAIGVVSNFFWNKFFTFKSKNLKVSEPFKFALVYLACFFICLGTLALFVEVLKINEYIAGVLNVFVNCVLSWTGHNFFSFRSYKKNKDGERPAKNDILIE